MNLNEAAENSYKSALQRQHNGADVKVAEILKHCAGEVIEAQEAFIMCKYDAHEESKYAEELADVIKNNEILYSLFVIFIDTKQKRVYIITIRQERQPKKSNYKDTQERLGRWKLWKEQM